MIVIDLYVKIQNKWLIHIVWLLSGYDLLYDMIVWLWYWQIVTSCYQNPSTATTITSVAQMKMNNGHKIGSHCCLICTRNPHVFSLCSSLPPALLTNNMSWSWTRRVWLMACSSRHWMPSAARSMSARGPSGESDWFSAATTSNPRRCRSIGAVSVRLVGTGWKSVASRGRRCPYCIYYTLPILHNNTKKEKQNNEQKGFWPQ